MEQGLFYIHRIISNVIFGRQDRWGSTDVLTQEKTGYTQSEGMNSSSEPSTSANPQTPEPSTSANPQTPEPLTSANPQTPDPSTSANPQTPEPSTSANPQTPEPLASANPQTPEPPTSANPQTPEPPTSANPQTPEPPTSANPQTPEPPTSATPQTPEPPTSANPQTPEPPTSANPQTPEPPTSANPQTPEPSTSANPQTPEPPTSANPQTPEPLTSANPQTPEPPTSANPQTPEPPTSANPQTPEPPTSTNPQTPEPPTSGAALPEIKPTGSFDSLYEVGKKLASKSHGIVHEGIRKSDGTQVIIKFVKKHQFDFHFDDSKPMCREAVIMLLVQQHSDHVVKLYEWFAMKDRDILIMEHPGTSTTLYDFIKENGGRLTEAEAKDIMQKLIAVLQHCKEQGVYYKNLSLKKILFNPHTRQIKLTGFYRALTIKETRIGDCEPIAKWIVNAVMATNTGLHRLLKGMVEGGCLLVSKLWFRWKNTRLSKECLDLLQKLRDRESGITLQTILDQDWFKKTPDTDAIESDEKHTKGREGHSCWAAVKPSTSASPQTPEPSTSASPQTPDPSTSASPQTPEPPTSASPQTPEPPTSASPQTPDPSTSANPQTPDPSTSANSQTPDPSTSANPQTPDPSTSANPQTPDPSTSANPQTPGPSTSASPQTPDPSTSANPQTPDPSTSANPQTPDPSTSAAALAPGEEPADLSVMFPEPTLLYDDLRSLYKVEKKQGYDDRVYEGIRRSDGQKVDIKFVERCRDWETSPEFVEEGTTLLQMQKAPTCDHFIRLYERFFLEDQSVLIMEHLPAYVTWSEFIRRNGGSLTEETVDRIMSQILVAVHHHSENDLFYPLLKRLILINPETLHIKYAHIDEKDLKRIENTEEEDLAHEYSALFVLACQREEHQLAAKDYLTSENMTDRPWIEDMLR